MQDIFAIRAMLAYQSEAPAQGEAWSRLDFAIRSILPGSADDGEYNTASGRWAKVREADLLRLAAAYRAANGSRPAPSLPLVDREAIARELCNAAEPRLIAGQEDAPGFDESTANVQEYWLAIADAVLALSGSLPPSPVGEGITTPAPVRGE